MLCLDDPLTNNSFNIFDDFFLYIYTIELALKVMAKGFVFNRGAYMRNFWNWIDFLIVITGYLPFVMTGSDAFNINSLRILRVFRPLRAIGFIHEMKHIIICLVKCIPNFINIMIIYSFFLGFFGIIALQLFSGVLKKRCFNAETGHLLDPTADPSVVGVFCGYEDCPADYICGKIINNPGYNVTNFDNIFWSLFMIFQTFTLNFNLFIIAKTYEFYSAVFFFTLVAFIGLFLLINLMISVMSTAYEAETGPREVRRRTLGKEHSLMTLNEYFQLKKSGEAKTYKIMTDPLVEVSWSSQDEVLETSIAEAIESEKQKVLQGCKRRRFTIAYNIPKMSEKEKEKSSIEQKWHKRMKKLQSTKLNKQLASRVLKNKKRINLPLCINSKLLKFQFYYREKEKENGRVFSEADAMKMTLKSKTTQVHMAYNLVLTYQKLVDIINEPVENYKLKKLNKQIGDYEEIYDQIHVKSHIFIYF